MRSRTRRARLAAAGLLLLALAGLTAAGLYAATDRPRSTPSPRGSTAGTFAPVSPSRTASAAPRHQGAVAPVDLEQHLDRMRHLSAPTGGSSAPLIAGEATTQPDLYAAEFVRRLLTQDYDTPRGAHLAWVQAESTPTSDPLVVGLVPADLRDRFAVYSVTDTSDGPAPVPTEAQWVALAAAHASTTVRIDRVVEPTAWANAVRAGRITDPGTTARLVAATVTRHTTTAGHERTETFSVALSLNLEGPPSRADWRFVTAVTYTAIPMGGSS